MKVFTSLIAIILAASSLAACGTEVADEIGSEAELTAEEALDNGDSLELDTDGIKTEPSLPSSDNATELESLTARVICKVHIGVTRKSGNTISGYGSKANCGTGTTHLRIQRSRWWGWEDLATARVIGSGPDFYVRYNCAGTGTHTYRTIHTGETIGGRHLFNESNHLRVRC